MLYEQSTISYTADYAPYFTDDQMKNALLLFYDELNNPCFLCYISWIIYQSFYELLYSLCISLINGFL